MRFLPPRSHAPPERGREGFRGWRLAMWSIVDAKLLPTPFRRALATALLSLLLAATLASAEDWPQFRGENSSGVSKSDQPVPTNFSPTENLRWSAKVGDGIGSPIVV